jgi:hypothetical protein
LEAESTSRLAKADRRFRASQKLVRCVIQDLLGQITSRFVLRFERESKATRRREYQLQSCAGKVDLKTAQYGIATDWIKAYRKYIDESPPTREVRGQQFSDETIAADEVWVNTRSGKYFKPGSPYYGKPKEGKFMTEIDALDSGYLPAGGTGR